MTDPETIVPLLLAAAGLTLPADEVGEIAAAYPAVRAAADSLHSVTGLADTAPVLAFAPHQSA
jgi:hypothetical protein